MKEYEYEEYDCRCAPAGTRVGRKTTTWQRFVMKTKSIQLVEMRNNIGQSFPNDPKIIKIEIKINLNEQSFVTGKRNGRIQRFNLMATSTFGVSKKKILSDLINEEKRRKMRNKHRKKAIVTQTHTQTHTHRDNHTDTQTHPELRCCWSNFLFRVPRPLFLVIGKSFHGYIEQRRGSQDIRCHRAPVSPEQWLRAVIRNRRLLQIKKNPYLFRLKHLQPQPVSAPFISISHVHTVRF